MKKVFLALLTVLALGTLAACGGDPDPESIELDESSVEIDVGESVTVSATVEPEDADQDVEWSSDDTSVATVDDGEITGVAEGSATITATSTVDEDITASVDVTVEEEEDDPSGDDDDPESISLSEEDLELEVGEQLLIEATVEPEEAEQDVEWSSDDEDVAEISGGVLEAIGEGEATITATSTEDDSVSASITVTVIEPLIDIADVVAMDDGEEDIFIEGVVTALTSHSTFFVEDSTGAIAVYDSDSSNDGPDGEFISEVAVGDRVRLTGEKESYHELNRLVPDSVEVLESDVDLPDPVNLDEAIQDEIDSINADIEEENAELEEGETEEDLVDRLTQDEFEELLAAYQGRRVSMSEYVVSNIDEDQYGTFTV
ncbi:MAG: Ig-like domain-containing protein, partial [Candidatus Izemoplasmataceae bacterium]